MESAGTRKWRNLPVAAEDRPRPARARARRIPRAARLGTGPGARARRRAGGGATGGGPGGFACLEEQRHARFCRAGVRRDLRARTGHRHADHAGGRRHRGDLQARGLRGGQDSTVLGAGEDDAAVVPPGVSVTDTDG